MPVLFDAAGVGVIFTYHTGDIPYTGYLARRGVAEDDLVGYLLDTVLRGLYVDGHLLVVVADAAAHGGDALCLQATEEHLLTDAVGLQALTVYVERNLLFLFTEHFYICHRGDATQTVGEVVAVLLQFTIAALAALNGYQQGRRVAEVVVDHDGQYACRQLRLETVQAVLDLRPYLVLVVHVVVEFHHGDTHTVLRRGGGLGPLHLTVGKEVALQGARHLLLHLLTGGTGIDGHHHALPDGGMGELVLWHDIHAVDAHHEQDADDEQRY